MGVLNSTMHASQVKTSVVQQVALLVVDTSTIWSQSYQTCWRPETRQMVSVNAIRLFGVTSVSYLK